MPPCAAIVPLRVKSPARVKVRRPTVAEVATVAVLPAVPKVTSAPTIGTTPLSQLCGSDQYVNIPPAVQTPAACAGRQIEASAAQTKTTVFMVQPLSAKDCITGLGVGGRKSAGK